MTQDDIATGLPQAKLIIAGRPRPGCKETYVIIEEPAEPVLMHFRGTHVPHFKKSCPHCDGFGSDAVPFWYTGASTMGGEPVILELTVKCFRNAQRSARQPFGRVGTLSELFGEDVKPVFSGLMVQIYRANFPKSPRVLRCEQRVTVSKWQYETRRELARIWGLTIRPRLYQEESA